MPCEDVVKGEGPAGCLGDDELSLSAAFCCDLHKPMYVLHQVKIMHLGGQATW